MKELILNPCKEIQLTGNVCLIDEEDYQIKWRIC